MAIQFPAGPFIGDTFPYEGMVYTYDGEKWTAATDKAYWDKTGDDLIPKEPGDNVDLGTGDLSANNAEFDGNGTFAGGIRNDASGTGYIMTAGAGGTYGYVFATETGSDYSVAMNYKDAAANQVALMVSDNSGNDKAKIGWDGSATFAGTVKSDTFDNTSNTGYGWRFDKAYATGNDAFGQITIDSASNAADGSVVFGVYKGTTATITFNPAGSAMFASEMMLTGLTTTSSVSYPAGWISSSQMLALNTSSARYKRDIETADPVLCLDIVNKLRPVWYRSNIETDNPDESYWGFIAEEVAEVEPRLTAYDAEGLPGSVDYARFTPVLTSVLQQALTRIEELEEKIQVLEGGAATADVTPEA